MNARLVAWSEGDLALLRRTNAPEMTEHKLLDRHRRYLTITTGAVFRIEVDGAVAGSIAFWEREWDGSHGVRDRLGRAPGFQGRGVAAAAARAVVIVARTNATAPVPVAPPGRGELGTPARAGSRHSRLHAFPVDHPASNAVCRNAGFTLVGECDVEYPKGHPMRCHDRRLDL
jgi:Acetyltransferase (GNAT) family